jgi:hypothetical protein
MAGSSQSFNVDVAELLKSSRHFFSNFAREHPHSGNHLCGGRTFEPSDATVTLYLKEHVVPKKKARGCCHPHDLSDR